MFVTIIIQLSMNYGGSTGSTAMVAAFAPLFQSLEGAEKVQQTYIAGINTIAFQMERCVYTVYST